MRLEKLRQLILYYRRYFEKQGVLKQEFSGIQYDAYINDKTLLAHCHWMLDRMEILTNGDKEAELKAHRWLGFIQGCLASQQRFTINELKEQSKSS